MPPPVLRRSGYALFLVNLLLGVAHLLFPEYSWGQGRSSYFILGNSLTSASWLITMQLLTVAMLCLVGFHRAGGGLSRDDSATRWPWLGGAAAAIVLSVCEFTRLPGRLGLSGWPEPDLYESLLILAFGLAAAILLGWLALPGSDESDLTGFGAMWLVAWGLALALRLAHNLVPDDGELAYSLMVGLSYGLGTSALLIFTAGRALRRATYDHPVDLPVARQPQPFPHGRARYWILLGVGATSFSLIFLQIILFQLLTIFGDYLTANSVISIALLGGAVGGLIGYLSAHRSPVRAMAVAALLMPVAVILSLATAVYLMEGLPLLASLLLMTPFVCSSVLITISLVRLDSHVAYFVTLVGSGLGALLVDQALTSLREEGSLLFLAAFTALVAIPFASQLLERRLRLAAIGLAIGGTLALLVAGVANIESDWLNVVRAQVRRDYPRADILFSRSSFVGRYDIVRRDRGNASLKAYENGRTIDTIRRWTEEAYVIDPRIPSGLIDDARILILGLSGDGVAKTAKALGSDVTGIEINPVVVDLQSNELAPYNGGSYEGIDVVVMDARSFVQQSDETYDMITLLNTHRARGRTTGRSSSPEYLYTASAIHEYLDHLSDDGLIVVEEPVSRPRREPPVWKLVQTMRHVLHERGAMHPDHHLYAFQWCTSSNNYLQLLLKKTPFEDDEVAALDRWLNQVDNVKQLEADAGRQLGPITAVTTILHAPGRPSANNLSRVIRGTADEAFLQARNLSVTTDDRPFHFDVDPTHAELKAAYTTTLLLALLALALFAPFLARQAAELVAIAPHALAVTLTGLGYLLLEMVLIQRYEIFLGSPVATFASVLGTLLICSGLGSLWSGRHGGRVAYGSLGAVVALLMVQQWVMPEIFPLGASFPLRSKIALTVLSIAPLAFFLGVPFPYVLRSGKLQHAESTAATLFAVNAAAGAVAVPLSFNVSLAWGLNRTFQTGILVYCVVLLLLVAIDRARIARFATATGALTLVLFVASPWLIIRTPNRSAEGAQRHEVYGLQYGSSRYGEDHVFANGSAHNTVDFAWLFWVVRAGERTILVDTGFDDPELAERWDFREYVRPKDRLAQMGIAPSEVTDVIITHLHWDHAGDVGRYDNATVWLQRAEYEYAKSRLSDDDPSSKGMRIGDLRAVEAVESAGRLRLVDGSSSVAPGVAVRLAGGHTPGSQYVTVEALDGTVVLAGDEAYVYDNVLQRVPTGSTFDEEANTASIEAMLSSAASPFLVLPGHEPRVTRYFPEISEGIVEITVVPE